MVYTKRIDSAVGNILAQYYLISLQTWRDTDEDTKEEFALHEDKNGLSGFHSFMVWLMNVLRTAKNEQG